MAATRAVLLSTSDIARGPWRVVGEIEIGETGTAVLRVRLSAQEASRFYRWLLLE